MYWVLIFMVTTSHPVAFTAQFQDKPSCEKAATDFEIAWVNGSPENLKQAQDFGYFQYACEPSKETP